MYSLDCTMFPVSTSSEYKVLTYYNKQEYEVISISNPFMMSCHDILFFLSPKNISCEFQMHEKVPHTLNLNNEPIQKES